MRKISYKVHWSYMGSVKRQGSLVDLILDIPYLMEKTGVVPPFIVINQVLQSGGDSGGMGPGTTWKPFQIDQTEYAELVDALLHLDIESGRQSHPYVSFERVILDSDLDKLTDYVDWLTKSHAQYAKTVI